MRMTSDYRAAVKEFYLPQYDDDIRLLDCCSGIYFKLP